MRFLIDSFKYILTCYILKTSPEICREVNLITLLASEDEGSHRHVSNVFSDPVHLRHHPVYFTQVLT